MDIKLTLDQLQYIRDAIVKVNRVKYQDFFEEIYDHYISSIEDKMLQGADFQEAFTNVHESFLDYEYNFKNRNMWGIPFNSYTYYGLEALQMEYFDRLHHQMYRRYWIIFKSMFGWPTIITTILIAILSYLLASNLKKEYLTNIILALAYYIPLTILLLHGLKPWWQYATGKNLFRDTIKGKAVLRMVSYTSIIWLAPALLYKVFWGKTLWENMPTVLFMVLLWSYILLIISFFQLYREQFKIRIA